MGNKYTIEVNELNPMETAPVWDYYDGHVEVVTMFFRDYDGCVHSTNAYYDRKYTCWRDHYSNVEIVEELIGWLPDYNYVGN